MSDGRLLSGAAAGAATATNALQIGGARTTQNKDGAPPGTSAPPPPPPAIVSLQALPPHQLGTKLGLSKKMKGPSVKMMSEATWKLVSKANDSTNDGAPNNVWDKINSSNLEVS